MPGKTKKAVVLSKFKDLYTSNCKACKAYPLSQVMTPMFQASHHLRFPADKVHTDMDWVMLIDALSNAYDLAGLSVWSTWRWEQQHSRIRSVKQQHEEREQQRQEQQQQEQQLMGKRGKQMWCTSTRVNENHVTEPISSKRTSLYEPPPILTPKLNEAFANKGSLQLISKGIAKSKSLATLSMARCEIGDKGLSILAQALRVSATLSRLDFSSCKLTYHSAQVLGEVLKFQAVRRVEQHFPDMLRKSEAQVKHLFEQARYASPGAEPDVQDASGVSVARLSNALVCLKRLSLSQNELGDLGAMYLLDTLQSDVFVEALDLQFNGITNEGAEAMLAHLKNDIWRPMEIMDLRNNPIAAPPAPRAHSTRPLQHRPLYTSPELHFHEGASDAGKSFAIQAPPAPPPPPPPPVSTGPDPVKGLIRDLCMENMQLTDKLGKLEEYMRTIWGLSQPTPPKHGEQVAEAPPPPPPPEEISVTAPSTVQPATAVHAHRPAPEHFFEDSYALSEPLVTVDGDRSATKHMLQQAQVDLGRAPSSRAVHVDILSEVSQRLAKLNDRVMSSKLSYWEVPALERSLYLVEDTFLATFAQHLGRRGAEQPKDAAGRAFLDVVDNLVQAVQCIKARFDTAKTALRDKNPLLYQHVHDTAAWVDQNMYRSASDYEAVHTAWSSDRPLSHAASAEVAAHCDESELPANASVDPRTAIPERHIRSSVRPSYDSDGSGSQSPDAIATLGQQHHCHYDYDLHSGSSDNGV
ncbi:hypothetical protein RI367_004161 [Sorochytrium milnesiophthora]